MQVCIPLHFNVQEYNNIWFLLVHFLFISDTPKGRLSSIMIPQKVHQIFYLIKDLILKTHRVLRFKGGSSVSRYLYHTQIPLNIFSIMLSFSLHHVALNRVKRGEKRAWLQRDCFNSLFVWNTFQIYLLRRKHVQNGILFRYLAILVLVVLIYVVL